MPELRIRDLTVEYRRGGETLRPIDGLDADVRDGELAVVLGSSGSGKTTLLSAVAGLLTPVSGSITIDGEEVTALHGRRLLDHRRHTVGVVFQAFNLVPSLTALENVEVALWAAGVAHREARPRAAQLLVDLGLGDRLDHRPSDLSGGQQQRVAIARALITEPAIVLADEPTAHLDPAQVGAVADLLRSLATRGRVVVVATHDPRLVPLADRVIDLSADGAIRTNLASAVGA